MPYINSKGQLYGYLPGDQSTHLLDSNLGDAAAFASSTQTLQSAQIDSTTGAVSGLFPESLVYVKNGLVYRAHLASGVSNTPVQVSSISDACNISVVLRDIATPDISWLVLYRKSSAFGCNNEGFGAAPTLVRANAATNDPGITLGANDATASSIAAVHDSSGHISSILVSESTDQQRLRRYDGNLQSPKDLLVISQKPLSILRELWTRGMYLAYNDPATAVYHLVRYDESTQSVAALRDFSSSHTSSVVFDTANAYVGDGYQVVRIPHSATSSSAAAVATTLPDADGNVTVTALGLSQDGHLIISAIDVGGDDDGGVWSAPATGGSPIQLFSGSTNLDTVIGNNVFAETDTSTFSASVIHADGSGLSTTANAVWGRSTQPQSFSASPGGAVLSPNYYDLAGSQQQTWILRIAQNGNSYALSAIDPLNPSTVTTLVTPALANMQLSFSPGYGAAVQTGFGNQSLMTVNYNSNFSVQTAIYGVDLSGASAPVLLDSSYDNTNAVIPLY